MSCLIWDDFVLMSSILWDDFVLMSCLKWDDFVLMSCLINYNWNEMQYRGWNAFFFTETTSIAEMPQTESR